MFDFLNSDKKEAAALEKRDRDFAREMKTAETQHTDDATYLETQSQKSDLIRWQQEFDEELDNLKHELLNQVKTSNGWEQKKYKEYDQVRKVWVERVVPPLCTEEFAEELIRMGAKPYLNKNAINSNLSEKIIVKMLRNTHNEIASAIHDKWGSNGIYEISVCNNIVRMMKNYIDPAAYRALNGWTKKTDSTMIKRIESQQEVQQAQQSSGLFGLFKSGG